MGPVAGVAYDTRPVFVHSKAAGRWPRGSPGAEAGCGRLARPDEASGGQQTRGSARGRDHLHGCSWSGAAGRRSPPGLAVRPATRPSPDTADWPGTATAVVWIAGRAAGSDRSLAAPGIDVRGRLREVRLVGDLVAAHEPRRRIWRSIMEAGAGRASWHGRSGGARGPGSSTNGRPQGGLRLRGTDYGAGAGSDRAAGASRPSVSTVQVVSR